VLIGVALFYVFGRVMLGDEFFDDFSLFPRPTKSKVSQVGFVLRMFACGVGLWVGVALAIYGIAPPAN